MVLYTATLAKGGTISFDLGQITRIDGGTLYLAKGSTYTLPNTIVTLVGGVSHALDYFEHGKIAKALQANGLI